MRENFPPCMKKIQNYQKNQNSFSFFSFRIFSLVDTWDIRSLIVRIVNAVIVHEVQWCSGALTVLSACLHRSASRLGRVQEEK